MSLINQMLRDLQEQKKSGPQKKPGGLRHGMLDRLKTLPPPLLLGGAALALLFFVWWFAGVLSGILFDFESTDKTSPVQQVDSRDQLLVPDKQPQMLVEEEQLSAAEREAGPPVVDEPQVQDQASEVATAVAVVPPPAATIVKPAAVRPVTLKDKPALAKVARATESEAQKTVAPQRKVVAKPARRLHPDDLPGAVSGDTRSLPTSAMLSRSTAATPYGMAEEFYLEGKKAFDEGRKPLAMVALQQALDLYPGHLPARSLLVETLESEGKNGEAMFLLAEGLQIAPDYIDFMKKYARLLLAQGDFETAVSVLLKGGLPAVETDPDAHVLLASLYQKLGESFLAAQTYRNLLVAWPETGAFWVGLGISLESQGLVADALISYQQALQSKNLRKDLTSYAEKRLDLLD